MPVGWGVLLAEPWGEGNREGEVKTWLPHACRQPQPQNREATPSSPRWVCQIRDARQWVWHPSPAGKTRAPLGCRLSSEEAGGSRATERSLISSFAGCPQAQQPQCWLLALCQLTSAAAQELAVRGPLEPPTPSWGVPTPLLPRCPFYSSGCSQGGQ